MNSASTNPEEPDQALFPTPSQTAGPYFHLGLTIPRSISQMAGPQVQGERIRLVLTVSDGEGIRVPDAMIELWQADAEGHYHHPDDPYYEQGVSELFGFGRLETNAEGCCIFETIKPGAVPANEEGVMQAPHINVSVCGRGLLKRLCTRIYFEGDRANDSDPTLLLVTAERKGTLLAHQNPQRTQEWRFDIHLCGEKETVFFAL